MVNSREPRRVVRRPTTRASGRCWKDYPASVNAPARNMKSALLATPAFHLFAVSQIGEVFYGANYFHLFAKMRIGEKCLEGGLANVIVFKAEFGGNGDVFWQGRGI